MMKWIKYILSTFGVFIFLVLFGLLYLATVNIEVDTLYKEGKYDAAVAQAEKSLAISEWVFGVNHNITGTSLNNLGAMYQTIGEFEKALPLYQRALSIAEKTVGYDHHTTNTRLSNLAFLYEAMGEYYKALPLSERALRNTEGTLGPDHPDTGRCMNNLALLYQSMGEYEKALPLQQHAAELAEKNLGLEHPDTATRLNNLALIYEVIGAYDKALSLKQRTLAIVEKKLGPEHPNTGASLNNLAEFYYSFGAYNKALPLYQRALAIAERAHGREHPETAIRLSNLAMLHRAMGEYDQALQLSQRSLAIDEKKLGQEHPDTGRSLNNLAWLFNSMGDYDKGLMYFQRALAVAEKSQGGDHLETANRLNNLAQVYFSQGKYSNAMELLQRSLGIAISRGGSALVFFENVSENICFQKQYSNREEAIFYCKLAVNARQSQRAATKKLPRDLQEYFAKSTENAYFLLNRLLNQANRTTESAQILRAMKETEFSEFVNGKTITKSQIDLTTSEAHLANLLRESAAKLQPLLTKQDALRKAKADQAELDKLELPISIAKKHLYEVIEQIPVSLKSSAEEAKAQFKIDDDLFLKHLAKLNAATGEKNAIIVITVSNEDTQISTYYDREPLQLDLPIAKDKLSQLVAAMQAGIVTKTDAWRAPARELHTLLIAPVEAQLAAKHFAPQNLSFIISGDKLEIPALAALLDANGQFLASKYRISLYNPQFGIDSVQDWKKKWDITAFASSKGDTAEQLAPLSQVANELSNIVKTAKTPQAPLPGEKYLDQQFTRQAWQQSITNNASVSKRRVLHVATHFKIDTNHYQSKLLLGDGQYYSAAEIAAEPGLPLSAVDLVTLSACNTVQRKVGKGAAFEGLGALFQSKGANAVLGTLWAVADGSTAELMQKFYANRGEQRKMSKAQALQEAQKAMMASGHWQHPYYWAGFVLMGNWL